MNTDRPMRPSDLQDLHHYPPSPDVFYHHEITHSMTFPRIPRPMTFPDLNALAYAIKYAQDTGDDPKYIFYLEQLHKRGIAFGGHGTHIPVLAALAAAAPPGDILELGAGMFSSMVFDEVARATGRRVWTLEEHASWRDCFEDLFSEMHTFVHVPAWDKWQMEVEKARKESWVIEMKGLKTSSTMMEQHKWAIAFVDHAPGPGRAEAVQYLADKAVFVIAHDTYNQFFTGLDESFEAFKYVSDYLPICPPTTIGSNFAPVPCGTPREGKG